MSQLVKKLTIYLLAAAMLIGFALQFDNWKLMPDHADAWGYYVYLPSIFIFHDLATLEKAVEVRTRIHPGSVGSNPGRPYGLVELHETKTGKVGNKYTLGVALMQAPFFAVGYAAAPMLGYEKNGFTEPFYFMLLVSAVFYPLLGLFFLKKTLSKYFKKNTVLLVLPALLFGTNLLYFSTINFMSHAYLFSLYCLLIYASDKWHETEKSSRWLTVLIGLSAGLITVIRPNEVVALAIPLAWGIGSFKAVKSRVQLLWQRRGQVFLAGAMFVLAIAPQLVYWHWISGEWLHDSYPDEKFDFTNSRIWDGFFDYRNGWLVWTPLMFLALAGLWWLPRFTKKPILPFFIFMPVHVVVIYAWWAWNYPNGFGSRPMVETYPLWAFPLAAMLQKMRETRWLGWLHAGLVCLFIALNVFQTWQWGKSIFWTQNMTPASYWAAFGKTTCNQAILTGLDVKSYPPLFTPKFEKLLYEAGFETPLDSNFSQLTAHAGTWSYHLQNAQGPGFNVGLKSVGAHPGDWLRVVAHAWIPPQEMACDRGEYSKLIFDFEGKKTSSKAIHIQNKIGEPKTWFHCGDTSQWGEIRAFVKIPTDLGTDGRMEFRAVKPPNSKKTVYLDDLRVELWR